MSTSFSKKIILSVASSLVTTQALSQESIARRSVCLPTVQNAQGEIQKVGHCDETQNNISLRKKILDNGCAEGQMAKESAIVEYKDCPPHLKL